MLPYQFTWNKLNNSIKLTVSFDMKNAKASKLLTWLKKKTFYMISYMSPVILLTVLFFFNNQKVF